MKYIDWEKAKTLIQLGYSVKECYAAIGKPDPRNSATYSLVEGKIIGSRIGNELYDDIAKAYEWTPYQ